MPKVFIGVRVEAEIKKRLEEEARKRGISLQKLVEHILSEYLNVKIQDDPCIPLEELRAEFQREIEELKKRVQAVESALKARPGLESFAKR